MSQRICVLLRRPTSNFSLWRELAPIDVDHGSVGGAQLIDVIKGLVVNFLRHVESFAAGFGKSDDLFQPGSPSCLHVNAGAGLSQGLANGFVNRKLIAARVNAQLEI